MTSRDAPRAELRNETAARSSARTSSWSLFGAVFTVHALIALAVGEVAWDDGYITLAFARTFAETGHIGLTPSSEIVEGATSPLWFLAMAGIYRLGVSSFYGFHLASQLTAALCAAVAAVLLYRLVLPHAGRAAWWVAFGALMLGAFRTETANGMEMTLLCVVVLGMIALIREDGDHRLIGVTALAAAVPMVRLEAAGYVLAGACALVVLSRRRRVGLAIALGTVASIAVISCARLALFGTFGLTNTMIAKQLSPYSPPFGTAAWNVQMIVGFVIEPVTTLLPAVVVAFVLARMSGVSVRARLRELLPMVTARRLPARIGFGVAYTIAYLLFVVVFGSNYFAPPGRMGASATLALIVAVAMAFPVPPSQPPLRRTGRLVAVGVLVLMPFAGIAAQDVGWLYLARLNSDQKLAFNSTVAYKRNGEAADRVRELLGQQTISVLLADVGAPSLCCERLEVLDLGLLANTELSEIGWEEFPAYLAKTRPDLIQTHGVWSQESDIYANPQFVTDYTPVVVDQSLFFLRNDLFDRLKGQCTSAGRQGPYFYAGLEPQSSKQGSDAQTIDRIYLDSLGVESFCRLA